MRERFMPSEREKGITQPFIVYCTATTPLLVDCCDIPYMKDLPLCSFSHNLSTFVRSFTNPFLFFHSTLVLTSLCPFSLPLPLFPFLTPVHPPLPPLPPSLPLSLSLRELKNEVPERGVLGYLCCCCWKKPRAVVTVHLENAHDLKKQDITGAGDNF